jgi:hypothetical protein
MTSVARWFGTRLDLGMVPPLFVGNFVRFKHRELKRGENLDFP